MKRTRPTPFFAFLVIAVMSAQSLDAQTVVRDTIERARSGNWYLRLTTSEYDTIQGRITRVTDDSVHLGRASASFADVIAVDRRFRRGGGAWPAGIFGAAMVGFIGLSLSGLCEGDCSSAALVGLAGGAAMGLAAGTAVGALIAPGRIEWRRVYPPTDSVVMLVERPNQQDPPKPEDFTGGGVTVFASAGWLIQDHTARALRLALQLGGTRAGRRPVETTADVNMLVVPDGGVLLGASAGANLMSANGSYGGPVVGVATAGDDPIFSLGARAGIRPRTSGIRPEIRADYFLHSNPALFLTLSLGLEVH